MEAHSRRFIRHLKSVLEIPKLMINIRSRRLAYSLVRNCVNALVL